MGKLAVFIFIVVLGVFAAFAVVNNEPTTLRVPMGAVYEIPKIGLLLFSGVFGALAMLVVFMIRDTRRFMATYQFQKKQKKDERLHALYSKAVNAILAIDDARARDALEEILKVDSEHTDALLRMGDISAMKEQYAEAVGYYRRAHASNPKNIEALFSIETMLRRTGRWTDALNCVEEILDIDADNLTALYRKRSLLEREGRWDELIDVQKTVLRHEFTDKERQKEQAALMGYRYEHARDTLERGELEKANKGFRQILREDKNFMPAYLGLAEAMLRESDEEGAVDFLEGGYRQTGSLIILARLEDMLINLGEPSRLIRTYRTSLSENPSNSKLRFFFGKLYHRLEMIDDAFETLSAMDTAEAYPEYHQLMGELYLRRNQCEKAVAELKKSIDMKKTFRLPYCCGSCGSRWDEWSGRCPSCGKWNTYEFNLHGLCKA